LPCAADLAHDKGRALPCAIDLAHGKRGPPVELVAWRHERGCGVVGRVGRVWWWRGGACGPGGRARACWQVTPESACRVPLAMLTANTNQFKF
jgi:hypothetical protein